MAAVKNSKACADFTAHSFFPNKCRECNQPKSDHAISASAAPAVAVKAPTAAVSTATAAPVKFTSPFKAPTLPTTTTAATTTVPSSTTPSVASPATPPTAAAASSTAASSIKQRLASLGGGFNPLLMNQSPPAAVPATAAKSGPSVDVTSPSSAAGESSASSPASTVRKPSVGVTRRQPSAEILPQFPYNPISPNGSGNSAVETEVRSEEVKAAGEQQQQHQTVAHTSPALSATASHAHATVPVVAIRTSASELFSPTSSAAAAEPTAETKAGALIGSGKNADMWDDEDSGDVPTLQPTPSTAMFTSIVSSTSSVPFTTSTAQPAAVSVSDSEAAVSSASSYLARQKATMAPVVSSTSSSLFGDDWDDEDVLANVTKPAASKPIAIASPTKVTVPALSEKRGLFEDMDKDDNGLFSPPTIVPVTQAAHSHPVSAAPTTTSVATVTPVPATVTQEPAPPAVVAASSAPVTVSSSTTAATAAPTSTAAMLSSFYGKPDQVTPTTDPLSPANKPSIPVTKESSSSSAFFKPGGSISTTSTTAVAPSASAASPTSSRPLPSPSQKQSVFFKVNSLGFEQKVSDAVTVVPVSQGRISEPVKPAVLPSITEPTKQESTNGNGKHASSSLVAPSSASTTTATITTPATTAVTTVVTKKANLFDDDMVDDTELFQSAATHPLGKVGAITSPVHDDKGSSSVEDDLFGDGEVAPRVVRQRSNVFENDGFA